MGGILEWLVRQALQKTADSLVNKPTGDPTKITQTQADEIVAATMVELEIALRMYQASQQASAVGTAPAS